MTNVSFSGASLVIVANIMTSEDCCDMCAIYSKRGCVVYTFVYSNPGNPVCYLKSNVTNPVPSAGAVSCQMNSANTSASASTDREVGDTETANATSINPGLQTWFDAVAMNVTPEEAP